MLVSQNVSLYTITQAKAFDDNLRLTPNVDIEIGAQRHIGILALKIYQPLIKGTLKKMHSLQNSCTFIYL
jgi:hypothetical protein